MNHGLRNGLFIASLLLVTVALAACGGSGSGSASVASVDDVEGTEEANADGAPELSEGEQSLGEAVSPVVPQEGDEPSEDPEEALLAFADCLRGQGLEEVQDPDFSGGGGGGRGGILGEIDRQDPEVQDALQACQQLLAGIRGEFTPEDQAERQDRILAFAECLREEHGLAVPDPDFSGDGPGGGDGGFLRGADLDLDDPDVQEALQDCRETVGFGGGPGGGGRFGGGAS